MGGKSRGPEVDWRTRFYWPSSPAYAWPWGIGLFVFFVLAAFGVTGGKTPGLGSFPPTMAGYFLMSALLLVFNAILFWTHVRSQYLTSRIAGGPFFGTYTVLTLTHSLLWGLIVLFEGTELAWKDADPVLTLQNVALGLAGLTPALLVSSLWKSEEPGVSNLRIARENAISLLSDFLKDRLREDEYPALKKSLQSIATDSEALLGRVRLPEERRLLEIWKKAAKSGNETLSGLAYHDIARRPGLSPTLESVRAMLVRSR